MSRVNEHIQQIRECERKTNVTSFYPISLQRERTGAREGTGSGTGSREGKREAQGAGKGAGEGTRRS